MFVALYIVARSIGKVFGTWMGCIFVGEDKDVRRILPLLMLPQAGVAAVEAVFAGMILGDPRFTAIILPAVIFFEVVGVFLSTRALKRWQRKKGKETGASQRFVVSSQEAARTIFSYLNEEMIKLDLQGNNINEVLKELADHALRNTEDHIDRAEILQMLGESESLSSSSLGNGASLPSCRTHGVSRPILVLGKHRWGIDFGGNNRIPSQIFLLMIAKINDEKEFMALRASALHLFSNRDFFQKILELDKREDLIKAFVEVKDGLSPIFKVERREIVKWEEKYSVDNIEIDAQHERLFQVINNFYNALIGGGGEASIKELVFELKNYTNVHFTSEEDLMLEYEYPLYKSHLDMHKEFVNKVNSLEKSLDKNASIMHVDLLNYLTGWITKHIYETDKQYAEYFREKGVDNWY
jgi:hemerythrin